MIKTTVSALILASLCAASAATGEVLDAKPATVVQVLSAAGFQPTLRPGDAKTQPSIVFKNGDENTYLYFSGCKDGTCKRATISTGYDRTKIKVALPDIIAKWNAEWYTQAYVDKDGDLYLDGSYLLTGEYTRANFLNWVRDYLNEMTEFDNVVF